MENDAMTNEELVEVIVELKTQIKRLNGMLRDKNSDVDIMTSFIYRNFERSGQPRSEVTDSDKELVNLLHEFVEQGEAWRDGAS